MFTGIIEERGTVKELTVSGGAGKLVINTGLNTSEIKTGDSICINGACITVTDIDGGRLTFDVSGETLELTDLGDLKPNDHVNVERALRADGRFDGHIVSGHVDGTGTVTKKEKTGEFYKVRVETKKELLRYIVKKGSIAVDGISLTVNEVDDNGFEFVVIPHTLKETNLEAKGVGAKVNLETDILAKYVEKMLNTDSKEVKSKVDKAFLAEHGFI